MESQFRIQKIFRDNVIQTRSDVFVTSFTNVKLQTGQVFTKQEAELLRKVGKNKMVLGTIRQ